MAISHANCTHPRTPAGRRACRAGNAPTVTAPVVEMNYISAHIQKVSAAQRVKARMDRDYAERGVPVRKPRVQPERIQPRRSGARVSTTVSTCVQAALHTSGTIRCACGWGREMMA